MAPFPESCQMRTLMRTSVVAAMVWLAVALLAQTPPAPKLAVLIVVDQMRADYVNRFRGDWSAGLKRLVERGAWFSRAAYPYLTTVTCPGHATIATGAFPPAHGIFQNAWYDRGERGSVTCTADTQVTAIGYGGRAENASSGHKLLLPTFADEMRSQRAAHVATLSLKDRSAIMLAGHGGEAVTWLSNAFDGWETSSAFSRGPVPAVKAFVDAHPLHADDGRTWTRLLPDARYPETDAGLGEAPPKGWTASFPHVLNGTGTPDVDFRAQWERSPFADAYLAHFAEALVESMSLGQHAGTDVLGISFSSPDMVGHAFGPASQEVRDIYAQLDRSIGGLLDRLDTLVGRNQYIVTLSADHGVSPIPEQTISAGRDAGRLDSSSLTRVIERAAQDAAGPGTYVARVSGNDVYFEPGMYDKLRMTGAALGAVTRAIQAQPGIARAFAAEDLRNGATSTDRLRRAAALSYVPGHSGDMIVVPKLGWMFSASGTTHATASRDDQRVPIIFMGPGVKAGEYREEATPADIVPTLAALCGITMSRSQGRVLRSALTFSPPATSPAHPRSR
ncbi:MAG: hypothetical protein EXQ48_06380 [Acidobacteria bacterium]|nr:hypothetical protein [Acidobacteriota bacterium]